MSNLTGRHQHIISKLKKEGSVNVVDLCDELNVSSVTIRKDLKLLEDKHLLFRTHGGGTVSNPYAADKHVNEKVKLFSAEKLSIGEAASRLIEPNDCILIASGTTVLSFAKNIQPKGFLTVITAALNVALELLHRPEIEVIQLGGILRKSSSSVTGSYAEKILEDFSCSKLFLGVDGIDVEFGLTTTNMMEAQLNKKMITAAQKTIVLADSSKFGKRGFGKICGLEDIEQVITDSNISDHMVETLKGMGIEVTIV
ncbi:MAG TPA: DeoR/GlpR family DNA-binding transcription regulator [Flavisolibacter sp.]|jgi:DeoR family transcriptional regulator of aga operon|nr:DeoR/GlpR family DNA-binding transcription regulator [Flavisolibacter sp.]